MIMLPLLLVFIDLSLAHDFTVRLGEFATVQLCYDGKWGYICPDGWSDADAAIVCKQLDLNFAAATASYTTERPNSIPASCPESTSILTNIPGIGTVFKKEPTSEGYWLNHVMCLGHESKIDECGATSMKDREGFTCSTRSGAATVRCTDMVPEKETLPSWMIFIIVMVCLAVIVVGFLGIRVILNRLRSHRRRRRQRQERVVIDLEPTAEAHLPRPAPPAPLGSHSAPLSPPDTGDEATMRFYNNDDIPLRESELFGSEEKPPSYEEVIRQMNTDQCEPTGCSGESHNDAPSADQ